MKITAFNSDVKNISKLSDRPNIENGYTSEALKALFDKAGSDIKDYINNVLIEELASAEGASKIGSGEIESLSGETVQDKLEGISAQIKEIANGTIPDGTITPEKFSEEISSFLKNASIRSEVFTQSGVHTFIAERDGIYKITLVGGGSGGGMELGNNTRPLGGGGGAGLVLWQELKKGDVCTLDVGQGGAGLVALSPKGFTPAQAGGDTVLSVNGEVVATAGGAPVGLGRRAVSQDGDINYSGGYPVADDAVSTTSYGSYTLHQIGGSTILGNGGAFAGDVAGIGGGGYAAVYIGSQIYRDGYKGGDGGAVIEYMK